VVNIRKAAIPLLIIILITTLSGCKLAFYGRTEMNRIEFIRAVGVDKSTFIEGGVRLTIATQSVQSGAGGGSQKKSSEILYSEGISTFEAVRNFWNHMDKRPFWGHVEYVIIGEEAAKDGLLKYIDFFSRDPELRLNLKVYEVKGMNAEEVIKKGNTDDKFIFEKLDGINENQWGQSVINIVDLLEVIYILDIKYLSLYLPCIELEEAGQKTRVGNVSANTIVMEGFAFFNGDKLAGYLDRKMGRGLNWLRNKVKSGIITVKSPQGNEISLEIIDSDSKLVPKIQNGELSITAKVMMTTNIGGIMAPEDIFNEKTIKILEDSQEQAIMEEIEGVIKYAQQKNLDFFGAGKAVFHKYPVQWEDVYEKSRHEIFPKVKINLDIVSKINRTYDIQQPSGSAKEKI
jgi:spore germination protein KC